MTGRGSDVTSKEQNDRERQWTLLLRNRMTGKGSDVTNKEQNDRERQ